MAKDGHIPGGNSLTHNPDIDHASVPVQPPTDCDHREIAFSYTALPVSATESRICPLWPKQ